MKIAIIGYGKMGKEIEQIAIQRGHQIALKINSSNIDMLTEDNLSDIDVAIEFTGPDSAFQNISKCLHFNTSVISGSTGWLKDLETIKNLALTKSNSFLYASNFSLGVNIFFELNKRLASLLSQNIDYKIQLSETHHKQKLDAPSGTAISLAKDIIDRSNARFKDWTLQGEDFDKLNISSYREDGVPGTHEIQYNSKIDSLELKHTAHSRKGFALGAVIAAEYILNKKGFYTMKDVLNV